MNLSPEKKIAGVLAPLFGLRSENDLGIGDVAVLREFIDWAAEIGFKLVQLLPINEMGADNSPYNAISAMAIEPTTLHLAPGSPEDLTQQDFDAVLADVDLQKLRRSKVRYRDVRKLKRRLLERAFTSFWNQGSDERRSKFRKFCEGESLWLNDYALFRALVEANRGFEAWDQWPAEQRTTSSARAWLSRQTPEQQRQFSQREDFFRYLQWIAHEQWLGVRNYAEEKGIGLMGAISFGVSTY